MSPREGNARGRVLLTDAAERSMLAACRGLRSSGYEVTAGACEPCAPGVWSRCSSDHVRLSDPRVDAARFIADLRAELQRRPYSNLLPGSDYSLLAVSRWRERLEGLVELGLPPHSTVQRSFDREFLAAAASEAGLIPASQLRCSGAAEAAAAADKLGYPVLLKSVSTVREPSDVVRAGRGSTPVNNDHELRAAVSAGEEPFLVQRAESGRTLSFGGVIAGERLIGIAMSAYERTWPPAAGNASASFTITPPDGLEEKITTLLQIIGWQGMFEIELIERSDGSLVPIDLNPRPYGSMALAVAAGVNLAALWCDWLLQRDPSPVRAHPGRRYRWEDADLRHLIWQLRQQEYAGAARTLRPRRRVTHPYFHARDPLPVLARAAWLARRKLV